MGSRWKIWGKRPSYNMSSLKRFVECMWECRVFKPRRAWCYICSCKDTQIDNQEACISLLISCKHISVQRFDILQWATHSLFWKRKSRTSNGSSTISTMMAIRLKDHHIEWNPCNSLNDVAHGSAFWDETFQSLVNKWKESNIIFTFRINGRTIDAKHPPYGFWSPVNCSLTWNYVDGESLPRYSKKQVASDWNVIKSPM